MCLGYWLLMWSSVWLGLNLLSCCSSSTCPVCSLLPLSLFLPSLGLSEYVFVIPDCLLWAHSLYYSFCYFSHSFIACLRTSSTFKWCHTLYTWYKTCNNTLALPTAWLMCYCYTFYLIRKLGKEIKEKKERRKEEGEEMQKELVPYPCVVVENQEGDLSCWGTYPLRREGSQLHTGLSARSICTGKRSPQNIWLWKSVGIPSILKSAENWSILLQGLYLVLLPQTLTLGFGRGTVAPEAPQTCREMLSCVASGWELEGQPPLSLCWTLLPTNWTTWKKWIHS